MSGFKLAYKYGVNRFAHHPLSEGRNDLGTIFNNYYLFNDDDSCNISLYKLSCFHYVSTSNKFYYHKSSCYDSCSLSLHGRSLIVYFVRSVWLSFYFIRYDFGIILDHVSFSCAKSNFNNVDIWGSDFIKLPIERVL